MLGITGSNCSYRDRVFDFIDSYSIFPENVRETAKGIYNTFDFGNSSPSNVGLTLIYVSENIYSGSVFNCNFSEIVSRLYERGRGRISMGRRLLRDIKNDAKNIMSNIDIQSILKLNEVIYSGSGIGFKESILS